MKKRTSILILALTILSTALLACSNIPPAEPTPDPLPHLISAEEREENPERPISTKPLRQIEMETGTKEDIERQLSELAAAVQLGYQPELSKASKSVQNAYDAAITLLNNIILNDFSDYQRIHAIYDYLSYYTEYDSALYNAYLKGDKIDRFSPSFDARGVFLYEKAVCEGIAEAFVILCGIEGIRSVMVVGEASDGETPVNHAWNRVKIDDKWYNVDPTFGSRTVVLGDLGEKKFLTHAYFLIGTDCMTNHFDNAIRDAHEFEDEIAILDVSAVSLSDYDANDDYGYYSKVKLGTVDNADVYLEANNQAELDRIFKIIKESKTIGKIEIRITFAEGEELNAALRSAYVGVPLAHFTWDGGVIRMVNNTFFCFIYK